MGRAPRGEVGFRSARLQTSYNSTAKPWTTAFAHKESGECFVVLRGSLAAEVVGETHKIRAGGFCRFPAGVIQVVGVETPVCTLTIRAPSTEDKVYLIENPRESGGRRRSRPPAGGPEAENRQRMRCGRGGRGVSRTDGLWCDDAPSPRAKRKPPWRALLRRVPRRIRHTGAFTLILFVKSRVWRTKLLSPRAPPARANLRRPGPL